MRYISTVIIVIKTTICIYINTNCTYSSTRKIEVKSRNAKGALRSRNTPLELSLAARLRREWQKGLTAFRRPFKPPRRGPTLDRKQRADRPAGYRLTSLGTAWPSSSRAINCACSNDPAPSSNAPATYDPRIRERIIIKCDKIRTLPRFLAIDLVRLNFPINFYFFSCRYISFLSFNTTEVHKRCNRSRDCKRCWMGKAGCKSRQ